MTTALRRLEWVRRHAARQGRSDVVAKLDALEDEFRRTGDVDALDAAMVELIEDLSR